VHPVLLRPHGHLFRQGVIASIAFMVPVFVVLYFLTIPRGTWAAVIVTQVLASAVVGLAAVAFFRVGIWVDAHGLTERGFFGFKRHVPIEEIGSIVRADTFDASGTRTFPQLFVCNHDGRQLVRMRGQFWSRESMDTVIRTLDVPFDPFAQALSTSELRSDHPDLLYWFERHPVLAALSFALATAALGALLLFVVAAVR
jgi:hypothetical protein